MQRGQETGRQIKEEEKKRRWCHLIRLPREVTSQLCAFTTTLRYFPLGPQHICAHVCIGVHLSELPCAVSPLQTVNNVISFSLPELAPLSLLSLCCCFFFLFCFNFQPELLPSLKKAFALHLWNINNARPCQDFQPAMLPISLVKPLNCFLQVGTWDDQSSIFKARLYRHYGQGLDLTLTRGHSAVVKHGSSDAIYLFLIKGKEKINLACGTHKTKNEKCDGLNIWEWAFFFLVVVAAVFKVSHVSKYVLRAVSQMTMGNKSHVQQVNSICKVNTVKYNRH